MTAKTTKQRKKKPVAAERSLREKILGYCELHPNKVVTTTEIAEGIKAHSPSVSATLSSMVRDGILERSAPRGQYVYRAPDDVTVHRALPNGDTEFRTLTELEDGRLLLQDMGTSRLWAATWLDV